MSYFQFESRTRFAGGCIIYLGCFSRESFRKSLNDLTGKGDGVQCFIGKDKALGPISLNSFNWKTKRLLSKQEPFGRIHAIPCIFLGFKAQSMVIFYRLSSVLSTAPAGNI